MSRPDSFQKWAVGLLASVILLFGGWVGKTTFDNSVAVAAVKADQANLKEWLERVEDKLDRALRQLSRDRSTSDRLRDR